MIAMLSACFTVALATVSYDATVNLHLNLNVQYI